MSDRAPVCRRHPLGWVTADGGCYVCWCEAEAERLRKLGKAAVALLYRDDWTPEERDEVEAALDA